VATARDVARQAGVSVSTVSHVLNETRTVSDALRQRVQQAARDLEYEPNAMARSLRIRRSDTLGLMVSDLSNPFFTAVVRGVEDVAQERGYALILCNSNEDPLRERDYLRVLLSRQVDGLMLSPVGQSHESLIRLVQDRFPLVLFDRDISGIDVSTVTLDNERAAFAAVCHLVELGHRRIGMVSGLPSHSTGRDRIAGYRRALREAEIPDDGQLIGVGNSTSEGATVAVSALLDLAERPTAVFATNSLMTIGALIAIQQRGLSVPEDISVVGFDDFLWSAVLRPRLTTVAQPTYELGRTTAELLIDVIHSKGPVTTRKIVLGGQLIVRESSGPVPEGRGLHLEPA